MAENHHRRKNPSTAASTRPVGWSPFDAVRSFPSTPETLMIQIDAAIASTEYSRACALLSPSPSAPSQENHNNNEEVVPEQAEVAAAAAANYHDAEIADEAYKAAIAAITAGMPDAAVKSLRVALASCPPDETAALTRLRSLLAIASAQLHKKQHQEQLLQQQHK